jgi:hypothetical protein
MKAVQSSATGDIFAVLALFMVGNFDIEQSK